MDWKVVPLSEGQLLDVRPEDVLDDGLYRLCHTYRGGGGYDLFPSIAARFGMVRHPDDASKQFVVQLFGCNLDCHYCYVTRQGVWGKPRVVSTARLVDAFRRSGAQVFHLMGGAPALRLNDWLSLVDALPTGTLFHSDLMLTERPYYLDTLKALSRRRVLLAINIKAMTSDEWWHNTRKNPDWELFWSNWCTVQESGVKAYITFTGCDRDEEGFFWKRARHEGIEPHLWQGNSFHIDLIDYNALKHVDDVPWGAQKGARDAR